MLHYKTQLSVLHEMLNQANIEHKYIEKGELTEHSARRMIKLYDKDGDEVLSAICHYDSYGFEQFKIEIMGLLTKSEQKHDSVVGWLTAKNVFKRIQKYLNEVK